MSVDRVDDGILRVDTSSDTPISNVVPLPVGTASRPADEQRLMDLTLLQLSAQGDSIAFGRLYDRLANPLLAMILRILGDRAESEDVLQETFVLLWKKAAVYNPSQSSVFSWATTLARGKAIDRLRGRQRRLRVFSESEEPAPEPTTATKSEPAQSATELDKLLAILPAEQRQAIDLAYFSGFTHEEISAQLSQPLGTIKARIRRGLLKLRETLGRAL